MRVLSTLPSLLILEPELGAVGQGTLGLGRGLGGVGGPVELGRGRQAPVAGGRRPGGLPELSPVARAGRLRVRETHAALLVPVGVEVGSPAIPVNAEPLHAGDIGGPAAVVEPDVAPGLAVVVVPSSRGTAGLPEGCYLVIDDPFVGDRGAGGGEEGEGSGREVHLGLALRRMMRMMVRMLMRMLVRMMERWVCLHDGKGRALYLSSIPT